MNGAPASSGPSSGERALPVLAVVAERLIAGTPTSVRMRGDALAPIVTDQAVIDFVSAEGRNVTLGDIAVARVDGRWVLRVAVIWGPARTRVLFGACDGTLTGWADIADIAGVAISVDGKPVRRPGRR